MNMDKVAVVDILRKNKYSFEKEENQIKLKLARRLFFIISFKEGQQTFSYYLKGTSAHPKNTFTFEWIILTISVLFLTFCVIFMGLDWNENYFSYVFPFLFACMLELLYYHRRLFVVKKRLGILRKENTVKK